MKTLVDDFGKVEIPKPLLESAGLKTGSSVIIELNMDRSFTLRAVEEFDALVNRDGLLIYSGKADGDLEDVLDEDRIKRMMNLA